MGPQGAAPTVRAATDAECANGGATFVDAFGGTASACSSSESAPKYWRKTYTGNTTILADFGAVRAVSLPPGSTPLSLPAGKYVFTLTAGGQNPPGAGHAYCGLALAGRTSTSSLGPVLTSTTGGFFATGEFTLATPDDVVMACLSQPGWTIRDLSISVIAVTDGPTVPSGGGGGGAVDLPTHLFPFGSTRYHVGLSDTTAWPIAPSTSTNQEIFFVPSLTVPQGSYRVEISGFTDNLVDPLSPPTATLTPFGGTVSCTFNYRLTPYQPVSVPRFGTFTGGTSGSTFTVTGEVAFTVPTGVTINCQRGAGSTAGWIRDLKVKLWAQ